VIGAVVAEIAAGSAGAGSDWPIELRKPAIAHLPRMFAALLLLSADQGIVSRGCWRSPRICGCGAGMKRALEGKTDGRDGNISSRRSTAGLRHEPNKPERR